MCASLQAHACPWCCVDDPVLAYHHMHCIGQRQSARRESAGLTPPHPLLTPCVHSFVHVLRHSSPVHPPPLRDAGLGLGVSVQR